MHPETIIGGLKAMTVSPYWTNITWPKIGETRDVVGATASTLPCPDIVFALSGHPTAKVGITMRAVQMKPYSYASALCAFDESQLSPAMDSAASV